MRNFAAVQPRNYIGLPSARPLKYRGIAGIGVPLLFNWLAYGASTTNTNLNAVVDLRTKEISARLIAIRSIYIDNMGSDVPIYVYFPDTQYTVVCQPNSAGWFKCYTNDLIIWVIGLGFLTGSIPATYIIVTNLDVENATDLEISTAVALWKASATIQRGTTIYNTNFGTPALGDQTTQNSAFYSATGVLANNLWNTPYSSGFLYLTHLSLYLYDVDANAGVAGTSTLLIESTGAAGTLYQVSFTVTGTGSANRQPGPFNLIGPFNSMNLKLDATQTWRLRNAFNSNGFNAAFSLISNFTTNPS